MPLLANLLSGLLGSLIGGLGKDTLRKSTVLVAALASFSAATVALMVVFKSQIAPLIGSMFSTQYGQFIGLAFPPVAGNCLASIAACWVGCAVYRLHVRITQATASA